MNRYWKLDKTRKADMMSAFPYYPRKQRGLFYRFTFRILQGGPNGKGKDIIDPVIQGQGALDAIRHEKTLAEWAANQSQVRPGKIRNLNVIGEKGF